MRLRDIEGSGGGLRSLLGTRSSEVAHVVQHRPELFGGPMIEWIDALMRGESRWSSSERELVASYTAHIQGCESLAALHGAAASLELGEDTVRRTWADPDGASLSPALTAALGLTRKLTQSPDHIGPKHFAPLREAGVEDRGIEDVIQICAAMNVLARVVDTLGVQTPSWKACLKLAKVAQRKGYAG